jgi:hypothetical protein
MKDEKTEGKDERKTPELKKCGEAKVYAFMVRSLHPGVIDW